MLMRVRAASVLLVMLAGCSGTPSVSDNPDGDQNATLRLEDFKFNPTTLNIQKGSSVQFVNEGAKDHTATAHAANGDLSWDTGRLAPGASKTLMFDEVGTFGFHCDFHASMTGTITVHE